MTLCQLLSTCFSLGHQEADIKIECDVQAIYWGKHIWRIEKQSRWKEAWDCNAGSDTCEWMENWVERTSDCTQFWESDQAKHCLLQESWAGYKSSNASTPTESFSINSLGEAWPQYSGSKNVAAGASQSTGTPCSTLLYLPDSHNTGA